MKFYKKSTFNLTRKDIREIINLKNSHWNYGFSSQLNWFKNKTNVFKSDFHFFLKNSLSSSNDLLIFSFFTSKIFFLNFELS